MLSEKERRRCEKLLRQRREWMGQLGADWLMVATGCLMLWVSVRQGSPLDDLAFVGVAGGLIGVAVARLFLAKDQRILSRLYHEWVRRDEAPLPRS